MATNCLLVSGLFTVLLGLTISECPLGWTEYKGECLYFSHDRQSWPDAESNCRNKLDNAYLATVDTADKQAYIENFASVLHHNHEIQWWLGSSDFAIEGSWRWVETGTGFGSYTNWAAGFPDGNRTHNCMLMKYIGSDIGWIDYNCVSKNFYICEKPMTGKPSAPVIG